MRAFVSGASWNVLLRAEMVNSWRTVQLRADQWRALPGTIERAAEGRNVQNMVRTVLTNGMRQPRTVERLLNYRA